MKVLVEKTDAGILADTNGTVWVDSRDVESAYQMAHIDITGRMASIMGDASGCSKGFIESNFKIQYSTDQFGQKRPYYLMTYDGFMYLASSFTGYGADTVKRLYNKALFKMKHHVKTLLAIRSEFPLLAECIQLMHEEPKPYHFKNERDLIYKTAIGLIPDQFRAENGLLEKEDIRPYLTSKQREIVDTLQQIDAGLVLSVPNFYHRKHKLEWFRMRKFGVEGLQDAGSFIHTGEDPK